MEGFLDALNKMHNPPGKEWRWTTSQQRMRNQAMHVITLEEFEEYKAWVLEYDVCEESGCGRHMISTENTMVNALCEGFLSDRTVAEALGKDNSVAFGFAPGEQPAFTHLDQ